MITPEVVHDATAAVARLDPMTTSARQVVLAVIDVLKPALDRLTSANELAFELYEDNERALRAAQDKLDRIEALLDRERAFILGNGAAHVTVNYNEALAILRDPWAGA